MIFSQIFCDYVIAADGATGNIREKCGIGLTGKFNLQHFMSVHFTCPSLAQFLKDRPGMLYFVFNPDVIAVLVAHNIEEGVWNLQLPYYPPHQDPKEFTPEVLEKILSSCLGVTLGSGHLDWQLHSARPWRMNAAVAHKFSHGRIFFAGDAAHQFPPSGGFGLNTGLQDAHNLAWKIAAVEQGHAHTSLLGSYHAERHQIARENAALSVSNWKRGLLIPQALGLNPETLDVLTDALGAASWALPTGASRMILDQSIAVGRGTLSMIQKDPTNMVSNIYSQSRLTALNNVLSSRAELPLLFPKHDLGFIYQSERSATYQDPCETSIRPAQSIEDGTEQYHPCVTVGARLPHGELMIDGEKLSTLDLFSTENSVGFILFVCDEPSDEHASLMATDIGYEIKTIFVSADENTVRSSDLNSKHSILAHDQHDAWRQECNLAQGELVLVRPDGHIAWRGHSRGGNLTDINDRVAKALDAVLGHAGI